jgi:hypothetical protein
MRESNARKNVHEDREMEGERLRVSKMGVAVEKLKTELVSSELDPSKDVAILSVDRNTQAPSRNLKANSDIGRQPHRSVFYEDYSGAQTEQYVRQQDTSEC